MKLACGVIDLNQEYGEHFTQDFDPMIRNIATRTLAGKSHGCPECGDAPTKKCFWNLHIAYCSASLEFDGKQRICGERFTVRSPTGCSKHYYSDGHNMKFKAARNGWQEKTNSESIAEDDDAEDKFVDVVPAFIGEEPPVEGRYAHLKDVKIGPRMKLGNFLTNAPLRGKAAKEVKNQRRAAIRAATRAVTRLDAEIDLEAGTTKTNAHPSAKKGAKRQGIAKTVAVVMNERKRK